MSKIPKSSWCVNKVYFKVKLVDDFKNKYTQDLMKNEGYTEEELAEEDFHEVVDSWLSKDYIEIYQQPQEWSSLGSAIMRDESADYFEKEDDNWTIPFYLWEVI